MSEHEPIVSEAEAIALMRDVFGTNGHQEPPDPGALQVETWHEFERQAHEPMRLLIDGLWPEAAFGFLAAAPKQGKTWVGLAMSIALATGRSFLGLRIPQPEPCIYVALEGHRAALRARIGALARGMNLDPDGPDLANLHLIYKPPKLNLADPSWAPELRAACDNIGARLLTVDVLRAAARIKENDQAEFSALRDNLRPLTDNGIAVCLLHHFTKLSEISKDRAPGERMSGTGAMFGALDVGIYITASTDNARRLRLEYDTRDLASPPTMNVELQGEGSGEHGGLTYLDRATLLVQENPPDPDEAVALEMRAWIIEQGGDVEAKILRAYFDISSETLTRRLGKLAAIGVEYHGGKGKPGRLTIPVTLTPAISDLISLNQPSSYRTTELPLAATEESAATFPLNHAGSEEVTAQLPQTPSGNSETVDLQGKEVTANTAPYGGAANVRQLAAPHSLGSTDELRQPEENDDEPEP